MAFVWKSIGGEEERGGRSAPHAVGGVCEPKLQPVRSETRLLDGRPLPPVGMTGEFYNGPVNNPVSGSICSPMSIASAQSAPKEDSGAQVWGWDPNKREEEIVIEKSSADVQTAFLVDEESRGEDRPRCTAFNGMVNSSEKSSFNTSYDSGVFDSYDSGVNADDNSVVE